MIASESEPFPAGARVADASGAIVVPASAQVDVRVRDVVRSLLATVPRIWPAWLLLVLAAAIAAGLCAVMVAMVMHAGWRGDVVRMGVWGPPFLGFNVVGVLILARYPLQRVGWVLSIAGVLWLLAQALYAYGTWGLHLEPGSLPAADVVAQLAFVYPFGLYLVLVELLLIFPTGELSSPRWAIARWAGLAGAFGASLGVGFAEPFVINGEFGEIANPLRVETPAWLASALELAGLGFLLLFAMGIPAAISMVRRLRRATGAERAQMQWIAWDTAIIAVAYIVHLVSVSSGFYERSWGWIPNAFWGLALNSIAVVTGIAILRFHLYGIHVVVNRTVAYAVMIAGITALYLLAVALPGTAFGHAERDQVIGLVAVTAAVAVLFQPVRDRLERAVNRLLFGDRDRPDAVLTRLGAQLEASILPEVALPRMTGAIVDTLKVPHAAVALADQRGAEVVVETGKPGETQIGFPMLYRSEWIGELRVTPRTPGEPLSRADRHILGDIARQAAVASYAIRVTTDLRRAREQLVTTREEERQRLRRDLHDGLGAQLAALTIQAGTVRRMIHHDPAAADRQLGELQGELRAAIGDIRRLVHGLRPPALDEFGLVMAIRSRLLTYQGDHPGRVAIVFNAPDPMPGLPAALEVAIYRIVEESVTNIIRHAGATVVTIRLGVGDGVELEIADDGRGIPEGYRPGVGIISMRERSEELGGTFTIEREVPSGTRLIARFPWAGETVHDG